MYDFVVGEQVRRRREMWSWDRIRTHREFFHEYKRLWAAKLTSYYLSDDDQRDIEALSFYSARPDSGAEYCDERVCLCVCVDLCMCVCMSAIISSELDVRSSLILCMLPGVGLGIISVVPTSVYNCVRPIKVYAYCGFPQRWTVGHSVQHGVCGTKKAS